MDTKKKKKKWNKIKIKNWEKEKVDKSKHIKLWLAGYHLDAHPSNIWNFSY